MQPRVESVNVHVHEEMLCAASRKSIKYTPARGGRVKGDGRCRAPEPGL